MPRVCRFQVVFYLYFLGACREQRGEVVVRERRGKGGQKTCFWVVISSRGLTDRQAQRHKEIVPESFSALYKVKYVNALSLPISGGSTPLLRRAGSEGGA